MWNKGEINQRVKSDQEWILKKGKLRLRLLNFSSRWTRGGKFSDRINILGEGEQRVNLVKNDLIQA